MTRPISVARPVVTPSIIARAVIAWSTVARRSSRSLARSLALGLRGRRGVGCDGYRIVRRLSRGHILHGSRQGAARLCAWPYEGRRRRLIARMRPVLFSSKTVFQYPNAPLRGRLAISRPLLPARLALRKMPSTAGSLVSPMTSLSRCGSVTIIAMANAAHSARGQAALVWRCRSSSRSCRLSGRKALRLRRRSTGHLIWTACNRAW